MLARPLRLLHQISASFRRPLTRRKHNMDTACVECCSAEVEATRPKPLLGTIHPFTSLSGSA
eukprot:1482420-Lingulodinium_polyedra.AAC.1